MLTPEINFTNFKLPQKKNVLKKNYYQSLKVIMKLLSLYQKNININLVKKI